MTTKTDATDLMETVLFTNINGEIVRTEKLSSLFPVLKVVANEWGLNLKKAQHLKTVMRIVEHSVKWN
jgi:hypothetical protein